jgi:hypothetical protein
MILDVATEGGLKPEVAIVRSLDAADALFHLHIIRYLLLCLFRFPISDIFRSPPITLYYAVRGTFNIIYGTK